MKKKLISLLLAGTFALITLPACTTKAPDGTVQFDPVKTEKVKAGVQPAISLGIKKIIDNSPQHAPEIAAYIRSAGDIFCRMVVDQQFSPDVLITALDKLVAPKIGNDELAVGKDLLVTLYRINYAGKFATPVDQQKWGGVVSQIMCDSIKAGLKNAGQ